MKRAFRPSTLIRIRRKSALLRHFARLENQSPVHVLLTKFSTDGSLLPHRTRKHRRSLDVNCSFESDVTRCGKYSPYSPRTRVSAFPRRLTGMRERPLPGPLRTAALARAIWAFERRQLPDS